MLRYGYKGHNRNEDDSRETGTLFLQPGAMQIWKVLNSEENMETDTVLTEVKRCLGNIERFDQQVNAFITVLSDTALKEAQKADENYAAGGGTGTLAGVPISIKDCIDVAGVRCTNGSLFFQDYLPGNPNYKMHLSMMYGTGLSFGPPNSDKYQSI